MNTPFVTIQGTLFNLDGIVSVRVDTAELPPGQAELVVETRLTKHCFDYSDAKEARRAVEQIVAKLKAAGHEVLVF